MSKAPIDTLLRAAALFALLAAPALSGCATDDSRFATSGTSMPQRTSGPWAHTPNEPNWRGVTYQSL
jgi:hypothetical protein